MKIIRLLLSTILYFFTVSSFLLFTILISINFVFSSEERTTSLFKDTEIIDHIKDPIQNQIVESLIVEYGDELSPTYRIQLSQQIIDQNIEKDVEIAVDKVYEWNREDDLILYVTMPQNSLWPTDDEPQRISIINIKKDSVEQKAIKSTVFAIKSTTITAIIIFVFLLFLNIIITPGNKITALIIYGLLAFIGITLATIILQGIISVSNNIAEEYITTISSGIEKYLNTQHIPYDPIENSTKILANIIEWTAQNSLSLQVTMTYLSIMWIMIFLTIRVFTLFKNKPEKKKRNIVSKELSPDENKTTHNNTIEDTKTNNAEVIFVSKKDPNNTVDNTVTGSTKRDIIKSGKIKIRKDSD